MKRIQQFGDNEHGSISIISAVSMVMIFGLAALAIDYGKLQGTYAKMRTAADAGALAGVTRIFGVSGGTLIVNPTAKEIVKQVALGNDIPLDAGQTVAQVLDSDIIFGKWDFTNQRFASTVDPAAGPTPAQIDTCQVTIRKNNEVNGRAGHLFSSRDTEITVASRAYVGYTGTLPAGSAFPLVIYQDLLSTINYGKDYPCELTTNSDQDDNCGYTTLRDKAGHAGDIKEYVEYVNTNGNDGESPPEVKVGDDIWLNNGDHANIYNYLQDAQASWPNQELSVLLPVVASDGGNQKFTHTHEVVDFVNFVITEVVSPGQGNGHENHGQGQTHPHQYRGYFQPKVNAGGAPPGQAAGSSRIVRTALIP